MNARKKSARTLESQVADHVAGTTTQCAGPSALRQRIDGWRDTLSEQINEHPVRTVAIALGTGYLLAGGLFTRLTARLVMLGMRIGLRVGGPRLVTQSVVALREARPRGRSIRLEVEQREQPGERPLQLDTCVLVQWDALGSADCAPRWSRLCPRPDGTAGGFSGGCARRPAHRRTRPFQRRPPGPAVRRAGDFDTAHPPTRRPNSSSASSPSASALVRWTRPSMWFGGA